MAVNSVVIFFLFSTFCYLFNPIHTKFNNIPELGNKRIKNPDSTDNEQMVPNGKAFLEEYKKSKSRKLQGIKQNHRKLDGDDGAEEPTEESAADENEEMSEEEPQIDASPIDENFETKEVMDAVYFIEYKMNEINALIQECIDLRFGSGVLTDIRAVRKECAGASFQILTFNYQESLRKIKGVLLELMKIRLEQVQVDHDDEVSFFLDILDQLIENDYSLPESLQVVKESSRYYVSPRFFDKIISLSTNELQAFHVIHKRLRDARYDLQKSLESHANEEDQFIDAVESKTEFYDKAFTPLSPDEVSDEFRRKKRELKGEEKSNKHHRKLDLKENKNNHKHHRRLNKGATKNSHLNHHRKLNSEHHKHHQKMNSDKHSLSTVPKQHQHKSHRNLKTKKTHHRSLAKGSNNLKKGDQKQNEKKKEDERKRHKKHKKNRKNAEKEIKHKNKKLSETKMRKIKLNAQQNILKLLKTKNGIENLGRIWDSLKSQHPHARNLVDQEKVPQLERGNEMGWEKIDEKIVAKREDIMGANGLRREI